MRLKIKFSCDLESHIFLRRLIYTSKRVATSFSGNLDKSADSKTVGERSEKKPKVGEELWELSRRGGKRCIFSHLLMWSHLFNLLGVAAVTGTVCGNNFHFIPVFLCQKVGRRKSVICSLCNSLLIIYNYLRRKAGVQWGQSTPLKFGAEVRNCIFRFCAVS